MRGKGKETRTECYNQRITPAYAGKRFIIYCRIQDGRDHPRLCGEKFFEDFSVSFSTGSPPPMRGKEHRIDGTWDLLRITPAYAGKSCPARIPDAVYRDHPRLCGEKE